MTDNLHTLAQELFAKSLVEGISSADQNYLDQHLRECLDCSGAIIATQQVLAALRNVPIAMPRDLAARTQLRVRLRSQETAQTLDGNFLLWGITGMSWLLGIFSAPLVWRGFAWIGAHFSIPKLAVEMAFVLWWVIPALFAVGAILHQKAMVSASGRNKN
jgi:hypothetical protein